MFRIVAPALLLATAALPARADDVTPVLKSGVWYGDAGMLMKIRYEYTFAKDGKFRVELLDDVANKAIVGTWNVVVANGKSQLTLASKDDRTHLLPAEAEVRHDKTKNVLVVRKKDGAEIVLKFRKGR